MQYLKFVCVPDGLYCINLDNSGEHVNYLVTVSEQKNYFSDIDNKKANLARYIQECLCLPSDNNFSMQLVKVESRSVALIEGTYKLPTSYLDLPRLQ